MAEPQVSDDLEWREVEPVVNGETRRWVLVAKDGDDPELEAFEV